MIRVTVQRKGEPVGPSLELADGRVVIGSSPTATVRLPATDAAAEHAVVFHVAGAMPRLEARSVLALDGQTIAAGTARSLTLPTTITLGACALRIEPSSANAPSPAVRTSSLARELVRRLMDEAAATPVAVALVVERGPFAGIRRSLPIGRISVGRGEDADWVVNDPDLSRHHAVVERSWDGVTVTDLGSKNGTIVDGVQLGSASVPLVVGGLIELGESAIRLVDPADDALRATRPRAAVSITSPPSAPSEFPSSTQPGNRTLVWLGAALALLALAALAYLVS